MSGHPERAVETARGQQALDAAVIALPDDARSRRLAGMRKRRGLTQEHVTAQDGRLRRPGLRTESGHASAWDEPSRFTTAPGGTLKLIADYSDDQLKIP